MAAAYDLVGDDGARSTMLLIAPEWIAGRGTSASIHVVRIALSIQKTGGHEVGYMVMCW